MTNHNLYVAAHPDDIETMMGHHAIASHGSENHAIVATIGEASDVNYSGDCRLCR